MKFTPADRVLIDATVLSTDENGHANVVINTESGSSRGVTVTGATLRNMNGRSLHEVWDAPVFVLIEGEVISSNPVASEVRFEDGQQVTVLTTALSRLSFAMAR
ncbi:hypothetical protein [Aeromicrobium sp. 179-A 4D2 NHS]|uniref:hypothetical protein n=1 Tax=Aeromicrobium sp. 179-A 4D2 NHS TaxID=3142375 RepID=UPI00399EEEA5